MCTLCFWQKSALLSSTQRLPSPQRQLRCSNESYSTHSRQALIAEHAKGTVKVAALHDCCTKREACQPCPQFHSRFPQQMASQRTYLVIASCVQVAISTNCSAIDSATLMGLLHILYELHGVRIPHLHAAIIGCAVQESRVRQQRCHPVFVRLLTSLAWFQLTLLANLP